MDAAAIKKYAEEQEAEDAGETRYRDELKAQGFSDDRVGEPYGAYLKRHIMEEKERAWRGHHTEKLKARTMQTLEKETKTLKDDFFNRYSPEFAQAPFEAAVADKKRKFLVELDVKVKRIAKCPSGF